MFDWVDYTTKNYHNTTKKCQDCGNHISLEDYLNASDYMDNNEVLCESCYDRYVKERL